MLLVRQGRQALSRRRLDLVRRRRLRQAAARRRDPQRDQRRARSRARATSRPARRSPCPAALGDETLPHLPFPEFSFGVNVVSGADEMRKAVRMFLKYGVDSIKLNLSGDNFAPASPRRDHLDERRGGRRGDATRSSCAASAAPRMRARPRVVKQALRHGIDVHLPRELHRRARRSTCSRPQKDRVFVAPGIRRSSTPCSTRPSPAASRTPRRSAMGYQHRVGARRCESLRAMHKRGIRILPGGDYGFALTPHGQNARDLEFFVKYLGFTPMEAIRSATLYGGQIMMKPDELGAIKDGYLADLLLVDGDPLANLVDPARPEAHPRRDEGRRLRQVARDRARARRAGSLPRRMSSAGRSGRGSGWRAVRRAARVVRRSGRSPTTRRCSSRPCSTA